MSKFFFGAKFYNYFYGRKRKVQKIQKKYEMKNPKKKTIQMIFLQNFFRVSIVFSIFFQIKDFQIKKKKKKKMGNDLPKSGCDQFEIENHQASSFEKIPKP